MLYPADRPYGLIQCTVRRDDAPEPGPAWIRPLRSAEQALVPAHPGYPAAAPRRSCSRRQCSASGGVSARYPDDPAPGRPLPDRVFEEATTLDPRQLADEFERLSLEIAARKP